MFLGVKVNETKSSPYFDHNVDVYTLGVGEVRKKYFVHLRDIEPLCV